MVQLVDQLGSEVLVEVQVGGERVFVRSARGAAPTVGDSVGIGFEDNHVYSFADDGTFLPR
jgi:hypothetical protein